MSAGKPPVVVGVDGSEQGLHAVQYAVGDARRCDRGLRLVHVVPELAELAEAGPALYPAGAPAFEEVAHRILAEAERTVRMCGGGHLPVELVVRTGARVRHLVEASEGARLVVLGHRDRSLLGRGLTASTSTGVASRSHCPVVRLPPVWTAAADHGQVVVGVEDVDHCREVLARAFDESRRRRARLRVLHTWKLPRPYDDLVVSQKAADSWTAGLADRLEASLRPLDAAYPDVVVDLDVRHQDPSAALLGASEGADLLVLGRRGRRRAPLGLPLGSTARALLREAHCPVEVTPLQPGMVDRDAAELALVGEGASPQV